MNEAPAPPVRLAIVGTAGHIDHGKTALVRRLTGIDTDRLPEEKRRGISIDLGFAPLVTPAGVHVGLVDVPGHERFVKNMLSGVGGIDVVLLVIAADEGVMPQTREHLAIVKLLGIPRGVIVLSKSDLVEPDWLELVMRDVRALVSGTALARSAIIPFSAVTGQGQEALLQALDRELEAVPARAWDEPVRLPVDRVFTMEGFGTVVTGTLWRGRVRVGDVLALEPGARTVRVRRVQVHGATVDEARAGQRTALALHGVERDQVARGDWLVAPGSLEPSRLLDVRFELLDDAPRAWPHHARVRFHVGASEIIGRLVLLEGTSLEPGKSALAQLRLERPTVAARGDRYVIRAYSPARTVGGGVVIEPHAARRRRLAPELEQLAVRETGSLEARVLQQVERETKAAPTAAIARAVSEPEAAVAPALARLAERGDVAVVGEGRWLAAARWRDARAAITRGVSSYTDAHPARFGIMKGELKSGLKAAVDATLFDLAFEALVRDATLEQRGERVRLAGSPWAPPADTLARLERVERELEANGLAVPEAAAWQGRLGAEAAEVVALGLFLGRLARVSQEFTYTTRQLDDLRARLAKHFASKPTLTVADFKDVSGVSRKYAVPLLEHGDRSGWTVRVGDERRAGGKLRG